jgi:hypothetical protein
MILGALESGGGPKWLETQMNANPVAFISLIGRVLPMTVAGDPDAPLQTSIRVSWAGTKS